MIQTLYDVKVTCREPQEVHIRILLLQGLLGTSLHLQKLESEHVNFYGHVCVSACLIASGPSNLAVENVIGRLSLEPSVISAGWDVSS